MSASFSSKRPIKAQDVKRVVSTNNMHPKNKRPFKEKIKQETPFENKELFEMVVEDEFWSEAEKEFKLRDLSKSLNMHYVVINKNATAVALPVNSSLNYQVNEGEEICVFQPPILNPNEFIILEHYVSKEFSYKLKTYSMTLEDFTAEIPKLARVAIVAPYIIYSIFKNLRDHDPSFRNYNRFNDIRCEIFKLASKNILKDELVKKICEEYFPVIRDAHYNREEVIARFIRDMMVYVETGEVVTEKFENTTKSNHFNLDYSFEDEDFIKTNTLIKYIQLIKIYLYYIVYIPNTAYGNIYV